MRKVVQNMQQCDVFAPYMKNILFHFFLRQGFSSEEYLSDGLIPSVKKKYWREHKMTDTDFTKQNFKFSEIPHK